MKRKYGMFLIIVLLLFSAVLSACNNDEKSNADSNEPPENFNETGYPIVEEPITLEIMGQRSPLQPEWGEMGFFKEMNKLTNIDFKYRVATSEQYQQQKQLAFASMELPDVFFGAMLRPEEEVDYGNQGLLIPLEGLIEKYAPNLQALMEKYPNLKPSITAPDGHIYALPGIDTQITSSVPLMWMNGYWLEDLGMEKPQTTEELYELLKAYKEQDPNGNGEADEIPLTASSLSELRYHFLPAFGVPYPVVSPFDGIYQQNDQVKYAFTEEGYKGYVEYLARLYEEELLDPQVISHTWEQYVAKGAANRTGVFPTWPIVMIGYPDPAEGENYPLLPALTSEYNDTKMVPKISEVKRGRAAITSKNKHPEATMRWLDHLYSEEGTILARLGIEGVTYEWNEDQTQWRLIAPEGVNTSQHNAQEAVGAGTPVPMVLEQEFFDKEDNPTIHIIEDWVREEYLPYAVEPFPQVYFTLEEQQRLNQIKPDVDTYIEQMEAKFVTGEISVDQGWDEFVSKLYSLGIQEVIEINQAAYDRWKEAK